MKPLWVKVVREADEVCSPSEFLSRLIEKQIPGKSVSVIPNGFNCRRFDINQQKTNNILIVCRMFERKGVQYFIRALNDFHIPLQVDIVGSGPYLESIKALTQTIHTDAKIVFHEWLENDSEELKKLYEKAAIFVFPSEAENFPIVLLEAMAAELAIISTKGTGCAEVVGDAAILVNPRDETGIRSALDTLLANPQMRKELGAAARARVENRFSWQVIANQYLSVYQKSIGMRQE